MTGDAQTTPWPKIAETQAITLLCFSGAAVIVGPLSWRQLLLAALLGFAGAWAARKVSK